MLSVMVPVHICLPGAAGSAAIARRLKIRGFISARLVSPNLCALHMQPEPYDRTRAYARQAAIRLFRTRQGRNKPAPALLFSRCHEVRGRRASIHDPHATLPVIVGQSE